MLRFNFPSTTCGLRVQDLSPPCPWPPQLQLANVAILAAAAVAHVKANGHYAGPFNPMAFADSTPQHPLLTAFAGKLSLQI